MSEPLANHPSFRPWFTAVTGLLLATIGTAVVVQLLTTPPPRLLETENSATCLPVTRLIPPAEGTNARTGDSAGSLTRDHCDRRRQERIATAILVAIPTAVAGSVGMTALVFRRQLSSLEEAKKAKDSEG